MNTDSFYKCSLFFDKNFELKEEFEVNQKELKLKKIINNEKQSYEIIDVVYKCRWNKQQNFNSSLPTLIIPTKDNADLIDYTLKNLTDNEINHELANVIVVDDRSDEDIEKVAKKYKVSYLRVDNEKGFNFSMLNNIPAKIVECLGGTTIICWNSDLWTPNKGAFIELLYRHETNNSKISGAKLVYPPREISLHDVEDTENIKSTFPHLTGGKWRGTVQFGGDNWIRTKGPVFLSPGHFKRFSKIDNKFVDCDRGCAFVTGAFQIWNLKHFSKIGGFNPSLSKNFQDVDVCLKSCELNEVPMYFGKDVFLYHDESLTMHNVKNEKKKDDQLISDHFLFAKIWNDKLTKIIF